MKIRTAATRRAIDEWKGRAKAEARKVRYWGLELVSGLVIATRPERVVLVPGVIMALSLQLAVLELGILMVAGFYVAKLHAYRFVNAVLGIFSLQR